MKYKNSEYKHILFYFGHPAQFHFARNTIFDLKQNQINVTVVTKSKDVLINLLNSYNLEYFNIQPESRSNSRIGVVTSFIKRLFRFAKIVRNIKPSLLVGTDAVLPIIGKIYSIPVITTLEDDYEVIKELAVLAYPFTSTILVPQVCEVGRWDSKKIGYDGFMKLAYLHPSKFKIDKSKVNINTAFVIIRLSGLNAYHDKKIRGVSPDLLKQIIHLIEKNNIEVKISSEQDLPVEFQKYELKINPADMHHYLSMSSMLISDSQSMSVEAAILGVPSIRISDFMGRISILQELEEKYKLTFAFKPEWENEVLNKLEDLMKSIVDNKVSHFEKNHKQLLNDKISVADFLTWFISEYPNSKETMIKNPNFQYTFK